MSLVVSACSYTAPAEVVPTPDTPVLPDSPLDTPVVEPDGPEPDGPPPEPTTTDHVASADTWINSQATNTNFSAQTILLTDGGPPAVTLMQFDLSGIASTTQVISAELHVFTTTDEGEEVTVFRLLEGWSEATATWNSRMAGVAWSAVGAAPPARGTTAVATFTPILESTEFAVAFDAPTVQGWVAEPATNFGIAITSVNMDGAVFFASESTTQKPFLRVKHVP